MDKSRKLLPLGKILNLIEAAGFTLEYHYDDLIFVNHTAFLFQFDNQDSENILLRFNVKCEFSMRQEIKNKLFFLAKTEAVKLVEASDFEMSSNEKNQSLQLNFKEDVRK